MTKDIKIEINSILQLPDDLLEAFWEKLTLQKIGKGSYYLSEGQFCQSISIVEQGAFYSFYKKEEKEIIEDFCFEACFIADYPSFINAIPVKKNFKALEDSRILMMSRTDLNLLYQSDKLHEKAGRLVAENLFTSWEQKVRDVILLSPIERYKKLIATRREVLQRVPQYLIASYLNITPEYLSHIRSKIIS